MGQRRIAASKAHTGRNVVVVGGTTGIGMAGVSALTTAGANVHLTARLPLDRLTAARRRVILIGGPQRFYRGSPRLDDLDSARPSADKSAYAGAKLACFCFASRLARRHPRIVNAIIDPGLVATDFQKDSPLPLRPLLALGLFRNEPEAVGNLYSWLALDDEPRRALDERGENVRFVSPRRELSLAEGRDMLVFGRERLGTEYQARLWEESARRAGLPASSPAGIRGAAGARP